MWSNNSIVSIIRLFLVVFLSGLFFISRGQDVNQKKERKIIQFSGIVIAEDSSTVIPGVHIYVPKAGRGAISDRHGYYSMPTLAGDSIVVSSVGFKNQSYVIPEIDTDTHTKIFYLKVDTTYLDNVDILPFPSEEEFKEAILALRLPDPQQDLEDRLDGEYLASIARNTPYDAELAARYWLDYQNRAKFNSYGPAYNPFLNPFNWARFIQDLKSGKYKNKD